MVMTALREGASGGILKFFLLGILALAAGGLVFTDMGGFFRGGITSTDVAKAGSQNISIQQFDRTLRTTLQRYNLTPQQAWKIGYVNEVLKGEMRASLMQQEAIDLGVTISNRIVAENIQDMIAPMVQPGQSPSIVLEQVLRSRGMSEQQMASALRRDMNVNFLTNTMQSGFLPIAKSLTKDIAIYEREKRNISFIVFKHADMTDIEEPTEEDLQSFYESIKEAYAQPEMRKITAVIIDHELIKETIEVSDEELQSIYDRTIDNYKVDERRSIEQVILTDSEQAEAVAEQVRGGKKLQDAVQVVVGNTTDYIPPRDTERVALLDELKEPVFNAKAKDILGPLESGLGYHVVVLEEIKPTATTPFAEVKDDIKAEILETRVLDAQYDLAASVDDYIAAGEPADVIEEELGVKTKRYPFATSFGMGEDKQAVFTKDFGADATTIITEASKIGQGEATQIMELADGRQAAFIVDEVKPKTYIPYEEIKAELETRWIEEAKRSANRLAVESLLQAAAQDEATLNELAKTNNKTVQKIEDVSRQDKTKGPFSRVNILDAYSFKKLELFSTELKDGVAVAVVTDVTLPDNIEEDTITTTESNLRQAQQKEAFDLYIGALGNKYSTRVNDRLLESVYGPESQQY